MTASSVLASRHKRPIRGFLRWSAPAPRAATPPHRRAHREMRVASCRTPGSGCIRLRYSKSAKSGGRRLIRSPHGTPGVAESIAIASRPDRTGQLVCPTGKSAKTCPAPFAKIFLFFRNANQAISIAIPSHRRGALRNVTSAGRDAVDAEALSDEGR